MFSIGDKVKYKKDFLNNYYEDGILKKMTGIITTIHGSGHTLRYSVSWSNGNQSTVGRNEIRKA